MNDSGLVANVDYVEINGITYTPSSLEGYIQVKRSDVFDRPMLSYPIVSESNRVLRPDKLSGTEKYNLDHSPYEFNDTIGESRFKTEFDYYSALMRAVQSNLDAVYILKRSVAAQTRYVEATYNELYDECRTNGRLDRGKNDSDRKAWFRYMYPALVKCRDMLRSFLEEIEIEEERLKQFASSTSRVITSTETSYSAQGKLFNLRS